MFQGKRTVSRKEHKNEKDATFLSFDTGRQNAKIVVGRTNRCKKRSMGCPSKT